METLIWFWNIAQVVLGLGFVIFIHELGHFLVAKWNGVKVEKFSIGFGKTLFGFRKGETEYVIAAVPLGGFVKMLGEGIEDENNKSTDPRAYPNKSIGARMAIISAGVIMNVLLGLVCFVYAYGHGMEEQPARAGAVVAGSPAYLAGLRPGDEIVSIDGRPDVSWRTVVTKVSLSGQGQVLRFGVRRAGRKEPLELDIQPVRQPGSDRPTIGFLPCDGLQIAAFWPPAGMAAPPAIAQLVPDPKILEKYDDTLVAAGPDGGPLTPLATINDYQRLLAQNLDRPIRHSIERRLAAKGRHGAVVEKFEFVLPPTYFVDLGIRWTAGPISAIRPGSPAEAAGFRTGDRIVSLEGHDDLDPMRIPNICLANAGKPLVFHIVRPSRNTHREGAAAVTVDGKLAKDEHEESVSHNADEEARTITVTPDDTPIWTEIPLPSGEDLEVPGLGLCVPIGPRVAAVRPGSPADRAGIKPGDVVNTMALELPKSKDKDTNAKDAGGKDKAQENGKSKGEGNEKDKAKGDAKAKGKEADGARPFPLSRGRDFEFDKDRDGSQTGSVWPAAFWYLQLQRWGPVKLTVNKSAKPIEIVPEADPSWPATTRGLSFMLLHRPLPPQPIASALRRGLDDTIDNIMSIYAMVRSLVTRRLSPSNMGGVITISRISYTAAQLGFTYLVHFLGILSINLAVLNFLPVPPLDGGQMLFLIAEKVRGRPLPESALSAGTIVGMVFVAGLIIFVTYQDIYRFITDYFF